MKNTMKDEMQSHLWGNIAPFWLGLIDREYGGFYGLLTYDLKLDKKLAPGDFRPLTEGELKILKEE